MGGSVAARRATLVAVLAWAAAACDETTNGGPARPTPTAAAVSCGEPAPVSGTPDLRAALVASGLTRPVDLQSTAGDCRLFVVEQRGRIVVVRDGSVVAAPFLDIVDRVRSGGEQGLLGLAFHPQYAQNGRFFVNYTDKGGDTHVAEFRAPVPSADVADPATERLLLFVEQPFANHNGGALAFGPDGFLYIGLGDGGSGRDPFGNGQNLGTHLGKMLRIDVNGAQPYTVPPSNPFLANAAARPEIWAYGLRNPWRFSFDSQTGDLLIGDVGQNAFEEIDLGLASRGGGENYGWDITEASSCHEPASGCDKTGLTLPIAEYGHGAQGCSVTGGYVYRGRRMPGLHGTYFYADYCRSSIRSFRIVNGQAAEARDWSAQLSGNLGNVSSFGVDALGELYMVDHDGAIYRIEPAP
jgi:glucose/arabinose dehydrogenase